MDEHTILEHLGNLGVILLAVLLSTSVHYLFLRHLNRGARLALKFPQIRLGSVSYTHLTLPTICSV